MHSLAPLLFTLILFNSHQLKTDNLYKANIFALVGGSYFVFLQYTVYWYRIFPSHSLVQYIPGFIVVLSTVGIALSPWNRRSNVIKTLALCGLFAIATIATFTFDKSIKETLAEMGGFFKREALLNQDVIPYDSTAIELPEIGIRLNAPLDWKQNKLSSGHVYFTRGDKDKPLLEVRPNCLNPLDIDTPTYLFNIINSFEAKAIYATTESRCSQKDSIKTCLVRVTYPHPNLIKEKWHWLNIPEDRSRSIGLDFLIYDDAEEQYAEIWNLIASIEYLTPSAIEPCRTPAAWL